VEEVEELEELVEAEEVKVNGGGRSFIS